MSVAKHIEGDPASEDVHGADAVDGLLHFAVTAVAALDRIGCRGEEFFVQEGQSLVHRRREDLLQFLAHRLEATNTGPKLCEPPQGCIRPTSAIEQTVDLVHDGAERPKGWLTSADPAQHPGLGRCQMMLDKEVTVVEEIGDLSFKPLLDPCAPGGFPASRTTAVPGGDPDADRFPYLCYCPQDRLGQVGDDVELANLMRDRSEDLQDRLGIESRTVSRDPKELQAAAIEDQLEATEERQDILVGWIMVENFVDNPLELPVVHDREHAERAVVELVGGDVARELAQSPIEVFTLDAYFAFFFPTPRPSFEPWQRVRRHDGLARDAMTLLGTGDHPRRPIGQPLRRRDGYSCSRARRGPTCRR